MADITAEIGDLLNNTRAEVHIFRSRCQEYRLSSLIELLVRESHLKLVLKIAHRAQTLYDSASLNTLDIIGKKPVKNVDNNVKKD